MCLNCAGDSAYSTILVAATVLRGRMICGEDTALYGICGIRCSQRTPGPVRGIEPRSPPAVRRDRLEDERLAHNFEQFFRLRVLVLSPAVELQIVKAAIIA